LVNRRFLAAQGAFGALAIACADRPASPIAAPSPLPPSQPAIAPNACVGAKPDPGRALVRPLSRREYDNTVRDLLGAAAAPAKSFSADADGLPFDTDAD